MRLRFHLLNSIIVMENKELNNHDGNVVVKIFPLFLRSIAAYVNKCSGLDCIVSDLVHNDHNTNGAL